METEMEALLAQFTYLAADSIIDDDDNFNPSKIEELMQLFEQEAYTLWSANEAEHQNELLATKSRMQVVEDDFEALMESAMLEYYKACAEAERISTEELSGLVRDADAAKKGGRAVGSEAATTSKKYIEAALASAKAKIKSTFAKSKVRPS